jgi:hypothetical protein
MSPIGMPSSMEHGSAARDRLMARLSKTPILSRKVSYETWIGEVIFPNCQNLA